MENFELPVSKESSILLIGKNGSGKTTVGLALKIFQRIARGTNRVSDLVNPKDLSRGRGDVPMRFSIEVELASQVFSYSIAFEFPKDFKELRVFEEKLEVDGKVIYARELAQVRLARRNLDSEAQFRIDWHLVALPIVQEISENDPIFVFKNWLANMLILRPAPALIDGDSNEETLKPNISVTNLGAWWTGLLRFAPSAYSRIDGYLRQVMPDLKDIKNPSTGPDSQSLLVQFADASGTLSLPFRDLSDGEKCFVICSLVLAANEAYGPLLCFWDEPDNYLALSEVGHFVLALRSSFQYGGQFIATSHNDEAIRRFSNENTLLLSRKNHLEPTVVRPLKDVQINGDLIDALVRGDLAI